MFLGTNCQKIIVPTMIRIAELGLTNRIGLNFYVMERNKDMS
jgi:hypothetical protein